MLNFFEDKKDINKEKINIKEAINYIVEAWGHVKEEQSETVEEKLESYLL